MKVRHFAVVSLVVLVFFLYLPGIGAVFVLDDYHILEHMGFVGGLSDFNSLMSFLGSGGGGPLGRPVALLTFAANAQNWPADPVPFILTNISIHAFNTLLVFYFVYLLFVSLARGEQKQALYIAISCAILWGLHPSHVSSVLYVVQRMTILSGLFSLLVFIAYFLLRQALLDQRLYRASGAALLCALFSAAAVLSKENAVLIPLFLLLVEVFLRWNGAPNTKLADYLYRYILIPAALAVAVYPLKIAIDDVIHYVEVGERLEYGRSFTMWERLLTQGRVLFDYMTSILIPKMQSAGVFHDQYRISKGAFSPPSTFFTWWLHIVAIVATIRFRKIYPVCSFGILWFYAGHLIESTVVMLEIKFEHRNYLPSLGLIIALVGAVSHIVSSIISRFMILGGASIIAAVLLWFSTSLWGQPYKAAVVWAHENPGSPRALEEAARRSIIYTGDVITAEEYFKDMIAVAPFAVNELKYMLAFCKTYDGKPPNWKNYARRIASDPRDWTLVKVIHSLLNAEIAGECDMVTYDGILELIDGFRHNKVYANHPSSDLIDQSEYEAAAYFQDYNKVSALENAIDLEAIPLWKTTRRSGFLATHGYLDLASMRLREAISLVENGRLAADPKHVADALEVFAQIENDRIKR